MRPLAGWRGVVCFLAVVAACGGGGQAQPTVNMNAGSDAPFTDEGTTFNSGYDDPEPKVEIRQSGGRWLVTAYQGQKTTGGYAIRIEKAIHVGTTLRIQARFSEPAPDAIVTQALTSPTHTIAFTFRPDEVVLVDQDGRERARARP